MKSGRTAIPKPPHPVYNIRINGIVSDVRKQIGMEVFMNVEIDSEYRARWSELRPLLDAEIERNRKQNAVLRVTDRTAGPFLMPGFVPYRKHMPSISDATCCGSDRKDGKTHVMSI